jgi:hypothetical protein
MILFIIKVNMATGLYSVSVGKMINPICLLCVTVLEGAHRVTLIGFDFLQKIFKKHEILHLYIGLFFHRV